MKPIPYNLRSKNSLIHEISVLKKRLAEIEKKETPLSVYDAALMAVQSYYPATNLALIRSRSRKTEIIWPRHIFAYLLSRYTAISLKQIGLYIGRDHSSIINSRTVVSDLYEYDRLFKSRINVITENFMKLLTDNSL